MTAAEPNRSRTSSTATSSVSLQLLVERQHQLAARGRLRGCVTEIPTSVIPWRSISGTAIVSSSRAAVRIVCVFAVAYGSVRERVAREESSKRMRRMTVRPSRSAARIRRVTRSTSPISETSTSVSDFGDQPSARCAPIEPRRRRASTGRGSRLCESACSWRPDRTAEQHHERGLRELGDLAHGVDARARGASARSRGLRPRAAPPAAGAGTRARLQAARRAARRAWRPRSRPSPGTSSARCRR